ncbi:MAG TPA: type IX secretion system membrane protein PorP/SprF [Cyclobacteriaceae bacterium]
MEQKNQEFGYSYDITISELSVDSGGSHEISLVYQFEIINNRKRTKAKGQIYSLPTFNSKSFWKR